VLKIDRGTVNYNLGTGEIEITSLDPASIYG
jgi:hypothetical protein